MLINCPNCKANVVGKEIADLIVEDRPTDSAKDIGICDDNDGGKEMQGPSIRYVFMQCPQCGNPLLAEQIQINGEHPERVYPPTRKVDFDLPDPIRFSYQEAINCLDSGNHLATALMCRRTLELVCGQILKEKPTNLAKGLKELRDQQIIDGRLFDWAEALRNDGNLAAHEKDAHSRLKLRDATDILDFTHALLDYVFVIQRQFEAYRRRREGLPEPEIPF